MTDDETVLWLYAIETAQDAYVNLVADTEAEAFLGLWWQEVRWGQYAESTGEEPDEIHRKYGYVSMYYPGETG